MPRHFDEILAALDVAKMIALPDVSQVSLPDHATHKSYDPLVRWPMIVLQPFGVKTIRPCVPLVQLFGNILPYR